MNITDKPCAAAGYNYRYKGVYGWIMIGANSHNDALKEALRSLSSGGASFKNLQVYDFIEGCYKDVIDKCK